MNSLRLLLALGALLAAPAQAARVVSLAPHITELVCAAGACEQLVGVGKYSNYPPQVQALPQVSDAYTVNAEAVLALKPDLILAWDGGTPASMLTRLRGLGLKVELVKVQTLDDVGLALLRVGGLLGTEDAACQAERAYRERLAALRQQYAGRPPVRVFYQLGQEPLFTLNRQSPISAAIELCGGLNLFAAQAPLVGAVSREAVIASNPDAILFGNEDGEAAIRADWARFPGLRAVRQNNLYVMDSDRLARATPRMAEGITQLCEALDQARSHLAGTPARP